MKASDCVESSQYSSEVPHSQATLEEMKAQMYYHVGTLLMKMAANVSYILNNFPTKLLT